MPKKRKSKKYRQSSSEQPKTVIAKNASPKGPRNIAMLLALALVGAFLWWQQTGQKVEVHEPSRTVKPVETAKVNPRGSAAKQLTPQVSKASAPVAEPRQVIRTDDDTPKINVKADHGTEAIAASTNGQLKALAKIILKARTLDAAQLAAELAPIVADDFSCGPLRPIDLVDEFDDGAIVVRRSEGSATVDEGSAKEHRGQKGLATALKALVKPWEDKLEAWCKFKQFLIEPGEDAISSTSFYELGSRLSDHKTSDNKKQGQGTGQHARWVCRWEPGVGDSPPRLLGIEVSEFEETVARSKHGTLFSDCTVSVLGHRADIENQLFHGTNYWRGRIEKRYRIPYFGQQGLAIGDVNGDGLDDVYLLQPGGLPNRLLIHQADGTVIDQSQEAGVDILDFSRSALLIDLDNDGDQDLVVSLWQRLMFLSNDGNGHFTPKAMLNDMKAAYSLAAADYDQDGDLDLFACIYYPKKAAADRIAEPIPYYNATNGGKNVLVRNEGNWQFEDVTDEVGLGENNFRFSFSASWDDFDNDGDLDLYVANDFGPNHLYRNDSGHFTDVAAKVGAEDQNFGMSASWGDFNRDGWMDMYISNMFSSAGNRVTFQSEFKSDLDENHKNKYRKLARGNTLLANHRGQFADVSDEQHVTVGRWAWGSLFVDVNNDGWEDLMVANGFITGTKTDDL